MGISTCLLYKTIGDLQKHKRRVLSFTRHSVQAQRIAYPLDGLFELLDSGLITLIHTCSTNAEYFSCQYVISLTTLSFLKEGTIQALLESSHDT